MTTACHKRLFEGATIQELTNHCVFSCNPGNRPLVSQVDDETYAVTHASGIMEIKCRHGNVLKKFQTPHVGQPGALEIKVPCDCSLSVNNQVYVSETYPCISETYVPKLTHVIPASWSKLKSLRLSPFQAHTSTKFETFAECLDHDWPTKVPHMNISFSGRERFDADNRRFKIWHQRSQSFSSLTAISNGILVVLVSIIIYRNPQLIGIGLIQPARAEGIVNEEEVLEPVHLLLLTWVITIAVFSAWHVMRWAVRKFRERQVILPNDGAAEIPTAQPWVIPLSNLTNKEITISVDDKAVQTSRPNCI